MLVEYNTVFYAARFIYCNPFNCQSHPHTHCWLHFSYYSILFHILFTLHLHLHLHDLDIIYPSTQPTPTRTSSNNHHTPTTTPSTTAPTTPVSMSMSTNGTSSNGSSTSGMYLTSSRFLDLTHHLTEEMPTWDAGMYANHTDTVLILHYTLLYYTILYCTTWWSYGIYTSDMIWLTLRLSLYIYSHCICIQVMDLRSVQW
jgi:hypothetical protein